MALCLPHVVILVDEKVPCPANVLMLLHLLLQSSSLLRSPLRSGLFGRHSATGKWLPRCFNCCSAAGSVQPASQVCDGACSGQKYSAWTLMLKLCTFKCMAAAMDFSAADDATANTLYPSAECCCC
eukprot:GHUV01035987.1.p3 GENE.GHUV01035987.1~~GHUV01035987.1.p3  ORF type:complete len:126 (-),score=26.62 GHUV01035987.1:367-744(-)